MLLYMALAPEQKLTYKVCSQRSPSHARAPTLTLILILYQEGGPAAEARFEAGVAGFEARSFRGCGVFTSGAHARAHRAPFPPLTFRAAHLLPLAACAQSPSRSRTVRHTTPRQLCGPVRLSPRLRACADADSVQMLTRSSQIGEFYVMAPPQVFPGVGKGQFSCDLLVYDEESDRHVRIQWADAVKACLVQDINDTSTDMVQRSTPMDTGSDTRYLAGQWLDKAKAWENFNKDMTGAADDAAWNAATAPGGALDLNVRIVIARPFIEHLMHNAILTVAGRDTGATLFGPADMCVPLRV